jgi:hypothetical protein
MSPSRSVAAATGVAALRVQYANGTRFPWVRVRVLFVCAVISASLAGLGLNADSRTQFLLGLGALQAAICFIGCSVDVALRGLNRRLDAIWALTERSERPA